MPAGRVTLLHAMPASAPHVERNEALVAASMTAESAVASVVGGAEVGSLTATVVANGVRRRQASGGRSDRRRRRHDNHDDEPRPTLLFLMKAG